MAKRSSQSLKFLPAQAGSFQQLRLNRSRVPIPWIEAAGTQHGSHHGAPIRRTLHLWPGLTKLDRNWRSGRTSPPIDEPERGHTISRLRSGDRGLRRSHRFGQQCLGLPRAPPRISENEPDLRFCHWEPLYPIGNIWLKRPSFSNESWRHSALDVSVLGRGTSAKRSRSASGSRSWPPTRSPAPMASWCGILTGLGSGILAAWLVGVSDSGIYVVLAGGLGLPADLRGRRPGDASHSALVAGGARRCDASDLRRDGDPERRVDSRRRTLVAAGADRNRRLDPGRAESSGKGLSGPEICGRVAARVARPLLWLDS